MQIEAIYIYHGSKIAQYFDLQNQIQLNGQFSSTERPLHQETFQLCQHATLDGAQL